jgi:TatA/E family protein of Tat protein translocase
MSLIPLGILSAWQWGTILIVFLLLFGHRLPLAARSLGGAIHEFKRGLGGSRRTEDDDEAR